MLALPVPVIFGEAVMGTQPLLYKRRLGPCWLWNSSVACGRQRGMLLNGGMW